MPLSNRKKEMKKFQADKKSAKFFESESEKTAEELDDCQFSGEMVGDVV